MTTGVYGQKWSLPHYRSVTLRFATLRSPSSAHSAIRLRIIAAGVTRAVAGADHLTYLVESTQVGT
jgi:hypothetical protein